MTRIRLGRFAITYRFIRELVTGQCPILTINNRDELIGAITACAMFGRKLRLIAHNNYRVI